MNRYRLASLIVVSTFFVSVTVTVLLPAVMFNPPPSGRQNSYGVTMVGDAARGRQLYIREGCMYCHSQYTRLQDRGMGPLSAPGDFAYETPNQLGTARTGPDLTNEGGKFPDGWHRAHLINPRAMKPGSIMPSFAYLSFHDLGDLIAYIQSLGAHKRIVERYQPPEEYKRFLTRKLIDTGSERSIQVGKGLYTQDCAGCHGPAGRGNGPASIQLVTKPADFKQGRFNQYSDLYWFFKISEGSSGTSMPRWAETLSEDQRWYLVAYLKTLCDKSQVDPPIEYFRGREMRHKHQSWEPALPDE
jgi:mono/diheme cytochrome c family protein